MDPTCPLCADTPDCPTRDIATFYSRDSYGGESVRFPITDRMQALQADGGEVCHDAISPWPSDMKWSESIGFIPHSLHVSGNYEVYAQGHTDQAPSTGCGQEAVKLCGCGELNCQFKLSPDVRDKVLGDRTGGIYFKKCHGAPISEEHPPVTPSPPTLPPAPTGTPVPRLPRMRGDPLCRAWNEASFHTADTGGLQDYCKGARDGEYVKSCAALGICNKGDYMWIANRPHIGAGTSLYTDSQAAYYHPGSVVDQCIQYGFSYKGGECGGESAEESGSPLAHTGDFTINLASKTTPYPPVCQGISDHYGISPGKPYPACMPESVRKQWSSKACNTSPKVSTQLGCPICQRVTDQYGLVDGYPVPSCAPPDVLDTWRDNECITKISDKHVPSIQMGCEIPCTVGPWGSWGTCSHMCAGGTQIRTKPVLNPAIGGGTPCPPTSETKSCNTQPCGIDCEVGPWGEFGACSGGISKRTRDITRHSQYGGVICPTLTDAKSCT